MIKKGKSEKYLQPNAYSVLTISYCSRSTKLWIRPTAQIIHRNSDSNFWTYSSVTALIKNNQHHQLIKHGKSETLGTTSGVRGTKIWTHSKVLLYMIWYFLKHLKSTNRHLVYFRRSFFTNKILFQNRWNRDRSSNLVRTYQQINAMYKIVKRWLLLYIYVYNIHIGCVAHAENLTTLVDLKGYESWMVLVDESEGLWNNRCATERSTGFVSVSISMKLMHLERRMWIISYHKVT